MPRSASGSAPHSAAPNAESRAQELRAPGVLPAVWEVVRSADADGATNMATDLVLMRHAGATGHAVFRVYGWSRPTLSFGRHERAAGLYPTEQLAAAGLDVVRRPTGGRALLHAHEITYSVSLPIADATRWSEAYDQVNRVLAEALIAMGVRAVVEPGVPSAPLVPLPDGTPCFAGISPGEIAVGGRKLVASAVWRERGAYLQHGSILLSDSQPRIRALNVSALGQAAPAATLSELVADGENVQRMRDAFEAAVRDALQQTVGAAIVEGAIVAGATAVEHLASAIARARAGVVDEAWLWRR